MRADDACVTGTPLSQSVSDVNPSACAAGTIFGCCGVMLEVSSDYVQCALATAERYLLSTVLTTSTARECQWCGGLGPVRAASSDLDLAPRVAFQGW
jgi:hypothetical protein